MAGPLFAIWGFGSGAMLAWGLAAVVPLLIHLWSRRRHQEVAWAAMEFLLAAMHKHARRLRMEQFVLLALRMLMLVLLALALADPFWFRSADAQAVLPSAATHYFLIVDNSFSMGYRERDRTAFQQAQQEMRRIVEQAREGDGFTVLLMGRPPRPLLGEVSFDRAEVLRQMELLQVSHSSTDLPATLAVVESLSRRVRERFPRLELEQIIFFSDLAQHAWAEMATPSARETVERLAADAELILHDVGVEPAENLAVTNLTSSQQIATPGTELQVAAEVQAFTTAATSTRLEFLVQGRVVHAENLQLAAGGRQTRTFSWTAAAAGDQLVTARIATDPLPLDNERSLVVPVRSAFRVLCIEGEPGAAEFVALALNPRRSEEATIQAVTATERALLEEDLLAWDAVFVCNVARLTAFEAESLHRYAEAGGAIVLVLGDRVQVEHYNRELAVEPHRLLPARIGELARGEFFFDPLEYRHPLVALFRGRERAGLLTVPVWRYYRLQTETPATVALGLTSGDPAVVEMAMGRGRVVLVATALSPTSVDRTAEVPTPWNALAAWPSFPPLIHGLLQMAIQGRLNDRAVTVGEPLRVPLTAGTREIAVRRPDQQQDRFPVRTADAEAWWSFPETALAGTYEVESIGADRRLHRFAVNLDPRESDLRRVEAKLLPEPLRGASPTATAGPLWSANRESQRWFRPLLIAVAMLLLLEQSCAVIFARRSM